MESFYGFSVFFVEIRKENNNTKNDKLWNLYEKYKTTNRNDEFFLEFVIVKRVPNTKMQIQI